MGDHRCASSATHRPTPTFKGELEVEALEHRKTLAPSPTNLAGKAVVICPKKLAANKVAPCRDDGTHTNLDSGYENRDHDLTSKNRTEVRLLPEGQGHHRRLVCLLNDTARSYDSVEIWVESQENDDHAAVPEECEDDFARGGLCHEIPDLSAIRDESCDQDPIDLVVKHVDANERKEQYLGGFFLCATRQIVMGMSLESASASVSCHEQASRSCDASATLCVKPLGLNTPFAGCNLTVHLPVVSNRTSKDRDKELKTGRSRKSVYVDVAGIECFVNLSETVVHRRFHLYSDFFRSPKNDTLLPQRDRPPATLADSTKTPPVDDLHPQSFTRIHVQVNDEAQVLRRPSRPRAHCACTGGHPGCPTSTATSAAALEFRAPVDTSRDRAEIDARAASLVIAFHAADDDFFVEEHPPEFAVLRLVALTDDDEAPHFEAQARIIDLCDLSPPRSRVWPASSFESKSHMRTEFKQWDIH